MPRKLSHQKIVVMLPTYNEAQNIEAMIHTLHDLRIPGLEILVVDDQSPDGTWTLVRSLMKKDHHLHLLLRTAQRGRGRAGVAGYKKALDMGADIICEMDADFSHDPKYLPALLKALESADMVLGSRAAAGGSDIDRPWFRRIITYMANFYTAVVLGLHVKDCNSGYRCFKRSVLESLPLDAMISPGPGIVQEVLFYAHLKGFAIAEVPISFIERRKGTSKFGWRHLYKVYLLILRLRLLSLLKKV